MLRKPTCGDAANSTFKSMSDLADDPGTSRVGTRIAK
jgi:hypothetical protein